MKRETSPKKPGGHSESFTPCHSDPSQEGSESFARTQDRPQQEIQRLLTRGVAEIIIRDELVRLLETGRPLRLKQGFDPSRPDIHLGHVVGLRKLRHFQQMGHQVVLIVGDWTARIGDPSGEQTTRPMLSAEEVAQNAQTYLQQFFKVVDRDRTEVRWQSEWYDQFKLNNVIGLTSRFTIAQLLAREDFAQRYSRGQPISVTEILYPLLQAYDSVVVRADVEFGGIDQKFNCLVGRELQRMMGQPAQQVFLVPLLIGIDGVQKMSKSLGNYIGIGEPPNDMYGKVMSIPDSLIVSYLELLTDDTDEDIARSQEQIANHSENPMIIKKRLAREILAQFHGAQAACEAEEYFARVFQKKEIPDEMVALDRSETTLVAALTKAGLTRSRAEARRLLAQGAIEIDGKRIDLDIDMTKINPGSKIKVGKHRFAST